MDSDELLIELMCEGNHEAIFEFSRRYISNIRKWLNNFDRVINFVRLDREDFVSELYLKVYDALSYYEVGSGKCFYAFAKRCVTNHMLTYLKKMNCLNKRAILDAVSLDDGIDDIHRYEDLVESNYQISDMGSLYDSKENVKSIKNVIDEFDVEEKNIMLYRYFDIKNTSISKKMAINEKHVEYKCSSIKKKLTSCIKT